MARFFVNRPIVAMVLSIVMVMLGVVAMQGLPIAQYPEIVPPMVQVTTTFVGASATDVEASVATPLEQKINGVENRHLHEVDQRQRRHADVEGVVRGRVEPRHGQRADAEPRVGGDAAAAAVGEELRRRRSRRRWRSRCWSSRSSRPTAPTTTTSCRTTRPSTSTTTSPASRASARSTCSAAATTPCASGCGPTASADLGITVPDIVNAINQQNQLSPAGQIGGPPAAPGTEYTYTVRTQGRLLNEEEFGDIIVRTNPDGSQVRLKDVARLELGTKLYNAVGRHNGKPSAVIAVFQIPGTNALEVADEIKATMEDLTTRFPRDMEYAGLARHDAAGHRRHHRDRPHAVRGGRRS